MLGTGGIADAPAGHGIGFRHAVHRQRALIQARLDLGGGDEFEIAIDEVLIHVVGQNPDMRMRHQHIGDGLELIMAVGRAGGVGRRVEHDPFGLLRDRPVEIGGLELEIVFERGRRRTPACRHQRHHFGIADPVGRRDHDLVAGVQRGEEGIIQNLLAAGADDGLAGL